jgi:hypothetical protein
MAKISTTAATWDGDIDEDFCGTRKIVINSAWRESLSTNKKGTDTKTAIIAKYKKESLRLVYGDVAPNSLFNFSDAVLFSILLGNHKPFHMSIWEGNGVRS